MSFDLQNLLRVDFPDALCPFCAAILCIDDLCDGEENLLVCPGCLKQFPCTYDNWAEYFEQHENMCMPVDELTMIAHARELMAITNDYIEEELNSLSLLLKLLSKSRHFVHFSTYSFSTEMLGIVAATALRIPVRGLIGKPLNQGSDAYKAQSIADLRRFVPNLELTLTGENTSFDETHSKLYVFDGIVALQSSANLTLNGWRKISESREMVDVITNQAKVRNFNNRYISRFMRRQNFDPNSNSAALVG